MIISGYDYRKPGLLGLISALQTGGFVDSQPRTLAIGIATGVIS
jgi:hypothetical protein